MSFAFNILGFILVLICRALSTNLIVLDVSSIQPTVGFKVAIRHVLVLPPNESYKSLVNFDSRYGIGSLILDDKF